MNHHHWGPKEGQLLQSLREQAGIDAFVFARVNTVSPAQLKELETGQGNSFYNPQIKRNTGFKLLHKLGHASLTAAPLATPPATPPVAPTASAPTHTHGIKTRRLSPQPTVWAFAAVLLASMAFLSLQGLDLQNLRSPSEPSLARAAPVPASSAALSAAPAPHPTDPTTGLTPGDSLKPLPPTDPDAATAGGDNSMPTPGTLAAVACAPQHRQASKAHTPSAPLRPGNYIYFEALQNSQLCVLDAQNKLTTVQLNSGMKRRINGQAPFLVHSSNWKHLKMFYQGRRVQTGLSINEHMVLSSQDIEP